MMKSKEPPRSLMSRYGRHVTMALLGVVLGLLIYYNGMAEFLRRLADDSQLWAMASGVGAYLLIAGRFLDPLAKRHHWRPFIRDYFNLAAFFVIVPTAFAAIYFGILSPLSYLAEVLAP